MAQNIKLSTLIPSSAKGVSVTSSSTPYKRKPAFSPSNSPLPKRIHSPAVVQSEASGLSCDLSEADLAELGSPDVSLNDLDLFPGLLSPSKFDEGSQQYTPIKDKQVKK